MKYLNGLKDLPRLMLSESCLNRNLIVPSQLLLIIVGYRGSVVCNGSNFFEERKQLFISFCAPDCGISITLGEISRIFVVKKLKQCSYKYPSFQG